MKGTSGDPFSQKGQIRLVRPGNNNIGLDPIIATSEPQTIYRFGKEVTFTANELWNPTIEYGDKLVIWTETYNYHKIIHCDWL